MDYYTWLSIYSNYLDLQHPLHILEQSKDPYIVGTAVILSGNTTDAAVNKILPAFLAKYPTAVSVLGSTRDEMIPLMKGIAHNGSKSDYIRNWAQYIVSHGGIIEDTPEKLTVITGIGRKTAGIILYRVLDKDTGFPLDTHCLRVLGLLGWFKSTNPKSLEKECLVAFPEGKRHKAHVILTQHGRNVCVANKPQCDSCKLSPHCNYFHTKHASPKP